MAGSFIPLFMYNHEKVEYYNQALIAAEQSGRVSDYLDVLEINSEGIEPYFGLINAIKTDGIFSKDEEKELLGYMNPRLSLLKEDPRYGELAYNMGKLYWFYYDNTSNEGILTSVKWFDDSVKAEYEAKLSNVYYTGFIG